MPELNDDTRVGIEDEAPIISNLAKTLGGFSRLIVKRYSKELDRIYAEKP